MPTCIRPSLPGDADQAVSVGSGAFRGAVTGGYDTIFGQPQPFALTGASPAGDVAATCTAALGGRGDARPRTPAA